MGLGSRRWVGLICAVAGSAALVLPGRAADLAGYERPYAHPYRIRSSSLASRPVPIYVPRCPRLPPNDYRPRLIGEPRCQTARPDGLSPVLYEQRFGSEWGVVY